MSVNYILYVHDCLRFPQCAIHFTFQTSVQIKHFILEHHLTHHTSTSILTHICDQKKKQQADHSDWYNPTDLLHLCLHYTVTQVMTPDVFTEGGVKNREGVYGALQKGSAGIFTEKEVI